MLLILIQYYLKLLVEMQHLGDVFGTLKQASLAGYHVDDISTLNYAYFCIDRKVPVCSV